MKTKRTLRTLRRTATDPKTVGFAGFAPTGKRVRTLAKQEKALRRLSANSATFQRFTRVGMSLRQSVKALTRFAKSDPVVQAAWLAS